MRACPHCVLEMVPLINNEGLVYTKPTIEMKVTVCSYHLSVQEVVDLDDHHHTFVSSPD